MQNTLTDFSNALATDNGASLADILDFQSKSLMNSSENTFYRFSSPWDEVLIAHVRVVGSLAQDDCITAAEQENMVLQYVFSYC
jgi:hypothetical protein